MKNDLLLFVIMLALSWIGFNLVNEQFLKPDAADSVAPGGSTASGDLVADSSMIGKIKTWFAGTGTGSSNATTAVGAMDANQSSQPTEANKNSDVQSGSVEDQIRAMMQVRTEAWNRGDLEGYMGSYMDSPSSTLNFFGETKKGWRDIFDFLRKHYQLSGDQTMGTLAINSLHVDPVGSDAALVIGNWILKKPTDVTTGRMSLVLRKSKGTWKIIHDHTDRK